MAFKMNVSHPNPCSLNEPYLSLMDWKSPCINVHNFWYSSCDLNFCFRTDLKLGQISPLESLRTDCANCKTLPDKCYYGSKCIFLDQGRGKNGFSTTYMPNGSWRCVWTVSELFIELFVSSLKVWEISTNSAITNIKLFV